MHSSKAKPSILVNPSGNSTFSKLLHPENAEDSNFVTPDGIFILVILLCEKGLYLTPPSSSLPIFVTFFPSIVSGIITSVSVPLYPVMLIVPSSNTSYSKIPSAVVVAFTSCPNFISPIIGLINCISIVAIKIILSFFLNSIQISPPKNKFITLLFFYIITTFLKIFQYSHSANIIFLILSLVRKYIKKQLKM